MSNFSRAKRADWYVWKNPPVDWVQQYAKVPGLQWHSDGVQINRVELHASHIPLLPLGVANGVALFDAPVPVNTSMLRPYQAADLPFLRERRGSLLAYTMRMGKTCAACHAHDPSEGPLVVLGPLAARDVWKDWIMRVHGIDACVLAGVKNTTPKPGHPAYFCHYDVLHAHTELFTRQRIGTLILDECHVLQGNTRRLSATNVLGFNSERVIGLSGTPMWGTPKSLYNLLHLLTPGAWGNPHEFGLRYCDAQPGAFGWNYKGSSCEEELKARLAQIMVRRTWQEVAPQLPPTTRVIEPVEVPLSQLAKIEAETVKAALAKGSASTVAGHLASLRRRLSTVKIKPAIEIAERAMQDGHKVVLWVWHKDVGAKFAQAFTESGTCDVFQLRGEDNADVRTQQVSGFRSTTRPAVMIAGIAVAGVAIDLSCSDYAIFAELDWTPAMVYQAEMRTFSLARPHAVVYLYTDALVEIRLIDALGVREGFANALNLGFDQIAKLIFEGL